MISYGLKHIIVIMHKEGRLKKIGIAPGHLYADEEDSYRQSADAVPDTKVFVKLSVKLKSDL